MFARAERERDKMLARGRQKKEEGGSCFLSASSQLFRPSPFACMLCMFGWCSNGPDETELKAEMKSSLMAFQRADRLE